MYRYRRLLIGLDFTDTDPSTIGYAAKVTRMAQSEKAYFLYVAKSLDIPANLARKYPELTEPKDETARRRVEDVVEKYFAEASPDTEIMIEVREGDPLTELLRAANQKLVDLLVIGKRTDYSLSRDLPEKVARKSPCSVLVVPAGAPAVIQRVLLPSDFSDSSALALEVAVAFASEASRKPPIHCLHVYSVPQGYHKTGKSYEEFTELMRASAEEEHAEFRSRVDSKGIPVEPAIILGADVTRTIEQYILDNGIDFLALGVRGKSAVAAMLLGSTTEKLIRTTRIPLIVVKKKGANKNLLEALLTG
ncbi:MAG: universal stress protein [Acidobacteria bacterium]|nr:universal stress protein [Acidobacteriota bacterium]